MILFCNVVLGMGGWLVDLLGGHIIYTVYWLDNSCMEMRDGEWYVEWNGRDEEMLTR